MARVHGFARIVATIHDAVLLLKTADAFDHELLSPERMFEHNQVSRPGRAKEIRQTVNDDDLTIRERRFHAAAVNRIYAYGEAQRQRKGEHGEQNRAERNTHAQL